MITVKSILFKTDFYLEIGIKIELLKVIHTSSQSQWCHIFSNNSSSNSDMHFLCQATDLKGSIYVTDSFKVAGPKGNKTCLHFLLLNVLRYQFTLFPPNSL